MGILNFSSNTYFATMWFTDKCRRLMLKYEWEIEGRMGGIIASFVFISSLLYVHINYELKISMERYTASSSIIALQKSKPKIVELVLK